jgi:hypothetical protein
MREGGEHGVNRRKHMIHIEKSRVGKGWVAHLNGAWHVTPDRDWKRYARQWRCVVQRDGRTHVLVGRTLRELDARLQALANASGLQ